MLEQRLMRLVVVPALEDLRPERLKQDVGRFADLRLGASGIGAGGRDLVAHGADIQADLRESIQIVTGPSFELDTFMVARNRPVSTRIPCARASRTKAS